MGFFPNDNAGPDRPEGVEPPRKTGFPRLWEILSRDLWDIFRAGFLALLGCAPLFVGVGFALYSHVMLYAAVAGLVGGVIAGPELCALSDTILRALRDEPGFWWHTYKRAWRRNARASLLAGAVGGLLLSAQVFLLFHAGALGMGVWMGALLVAGMLLALAMSQYVWPQLALMELGFAQVLKNSALLCLGQLPRTVGALAITAVYWAFMLWTIQLSITLLPLTNFWLPTLPSLFLIYPALEENFHIEEQLREKGRRSEEG